MKYKLLKDLPYIKAGTEFELNPVSGDLVAAYPEGSVRKGRCISLNYRGDDGKNHIPTDWFKETPGYERWRAGKGETYHYLNSCGSTCCSTEDHMIGIDSFRYRTGNHFQTEEEVYHLRDKLIAYQTIKDDANGFEPDWKNRGQEKWVGIYDHYGDRLCAMVIDEWQDVGQIYFATEDDLIWSQKHHRKEWTTLFSVEE